MRSKPTKLAEQEEKQREEFRRKLDELRTIITDGIAYFSAWRSVVPEDEESVSALNRYSGFFVPAHAALWGTALIQFAKVFDRHRGTISLANLLKEAKANPDLLTPYAEKHDLDRIEAHVNANKAVLESLKHLRDKRLAHHDATVANSKPLLLGQVQQLVEDIKSMYNSLRRGHDRNITSFERISDNSERHTTEVVRIMREERDRATRRYEEQLRGVINMMRKEGRSLEEIAGATGVDGETVGRILAGSEIAIPEVSNERG